MAQAIKTDLNLQEITPPAAEKLSISSDNDSRYDIKNKRAPVPNVIPPINKDSTPISAAISKKTVTLKGNWISL